MGIVASTLALLRHLRAERGMALVLVVVVVFTAFIMAAAPRLYNQTLDDELQYRAAGAPADWRNISVTKQQRTSVDGDETILERLETGTLRYYLNLPAALQRIINGFGYFTESQKSPVLQTRLQPPLEFRSTIQFRFQGDLAEHITLVDGRWPEPRQPALFSELTATPGARGEQPKALYEVAVSETTLTDLGYERGQLATVRLNATGERVFVRVVGVFEVYDPNENYWNADTRLNEPVVAGFGTDFGEVIGAVALPPVAVYQDMLERAGGRSPWHNEWTFYVDSERLNVENYSEVAAEIRLLKVTLGPIDELRKPEETYLASTDIRPQITFPEFDETEPEVQNELPLVMDRFAGQVRLTSSIIALATIGILGVGLAALGLLAALIADRRRDTVALLRSRGSSKRQLGVARLVEGLILCIPAALIGLLLATLAVDARSSPWSLRTAGATGLLTVGLLLVAAGGNILPRLGTLIGDRLRISRGVSLRRLIIEALTVLLAAVGIFLLRQRGLEPAGDSEGLGGFDPYLTAAPVLLALAAGVVLLRLYPYPVRLLARLARRLRGVALFMGLRRMAYQSPAANLPLLVLLLAVGVSVFTSIVAHSVDRARIDRVWTDVRADYRLETLPGYGSVLPDLDLTGAPGLEAQAREFRSNQAAITWEGLDSTWQGLNRRSGNIPPFTLLAVEPEQYHRIIDGTAVDYDFPDALLADRIPVGIGTLDNPAPAIISTSWPEEAGERPPVGTLLHFKVSSDQFTSAPSVFVEVVAVRETYPSTGDGVPFVIMRWDAFIATVEPQHPRPVRPSTIFVGGPDLQRADLEAEITWRDIPLGITIVSREEALEALRDAPIARGLVNSFRLSVALAAIYGGLVVIVAMVLTARERSRDLGYLRTLGLGSRQALGMTLAETVPGVLLASGLGIPLGIAIARLVEPGLDLRAFVGPDIPVTVVVDRPTAIAVATGLALVSLLAIAIFSILARRVQLGEVLRVE